MEKSIEGFLLENFHKESPRFGNARSIVDDLLAKVFSRVIQVRGDGNCLIRATIIHLLETRDMDVLFTIFEPFLGSSTFSFLDTKADDLFEKLVLSIRSNVLSKAEDLAGDQANLVPYYMDGTAIDGPARTMVFKLLNVQKATIYSLAPSVGDLNPTVFEIDGPFLSDVATWDINLICAQGMCHYSVLLK